MKIVISQQDKKLSIEFFQGKLVDKFVIDKADDFLACIDKFLNKRNNVKGYTSKAGLKFVNVSILTERIIRAIMIGLRF